MASFTINAILGNTTQKGEETNIVVQRHYGDESREQESLTGLLCFYNSMHACMYVLTCLYLVALE